MKPLKKLAGQTAVYGLSSVVGRLLNYLLVPLYTRYFLPEEYSIVIEMYAYVAFLAILLTYGFETAFFNFSEQENSTKDVYNTAFISLTVSSTIFVLFMFAGSTAIANYLGVGIESKYVEWFAIIIALDAISSIVFAKLRKEERAVRFVIIRLFGIAINIGLNVYFIVYKGLGVEYIFISNLISSIAIVFCLSSEILKVRFVFKINLWKKMMLYALPLLVAGLAGMTNETIDRVLLKHLLPNTETAAHELGLYGAFYKLSIIMTLFIQTFRFAAEPFYFAQHKKREGRKIYAEVMNYFVLFMIVVFLTAIIFYDFLILLIGSEYHDERGFVLVSTLLLANLFLGIFINLSIWYKLTNKTIFGAYLSLFGAIITLTLNFILIPKIGIMGSALATLVCYFTMALASYIIGKKHFPIKYQSRKIVLYLAIMLSIYFVVYNQFFNLGVNVVFLIGFIIFVYLQEQKKDMSYES